LAQHCDIKGMTIGYRRKLPLPYLIKTNRLALTCFQHRQQALLFSWLHIPPSSNFRDGTITTVAKTGCFVNATNPDTGGLHFYCIV